MKLNKSINVLICIVLTICFNNIQSNQIKSNLNQYISPEIIRTDTYYNTLVTNSNTNQSNNYSTFSNNNLVSPIITSSVGVTRTDCACAKEVKCQPCSSVYVIPRTISSCPCAPKPSCPVCPSLSLIHNLAAQKVLFNQFKIG
jgi:hypothetical protein